MNGRRVDKKGRSCGNCGMRSIPCDLKGCSKSKDGYGFWRPEGAALVTEEVEENKRVSTRLGSELK